MNKTDFLWVEKYRPQTIEDCILPDSAKQMFQEFLNKKEIPNLLLSGPPGIGKTTVAKALCHELGVDYYVINGSDEGRFLDTVRNQARISLRPSHYLHLTQSTKSSLLTKATTQPTMYNSSYGQILRRFITTVDSSSPVTTKTRSSNPSTVDAPVLIFPSLVNKNQQSLQSSSDASNKSWIQKVLNMITRSW